LTVVDLIRFKLILKIIASSTEAVKANLKITSTIPYIWMGRETRITHEL